MAKHQKPDSKKHTESPNGRPTIGFLNASGLQFFHLAWRGYADVARERNINAICFDGNYAYDPEGFKAQANILYDLIDAEQLLPIPSESALWSASPSKYGVHLSFGLSRIGQNTSEHQ